MEEMKVISDRNVRYGHSVHSMVVENVNSALCDGLFYLKICGKQSASRNGPVVVAPGPVATTYLYPRERVLFNPTRDANPFFHFFESMWMLHGRNDAKFLSVFNSRMENYAEEGVLHGAYGWRWRHLFTDDQLIRVIEELRVPDNRRVVLQMWDAYMDFLIHEPNKDIPCNTHCYFDLRDGMLNMTVCCRSNDMLWGAYGANVVHFSYLQEYIANALNVDVGTYTQFSNNAHVYTDVYNILDDNVIGPLIQIHDCYSATSILEHKLPFDPVVPYDHMFTPRTQFEFEKDMNVFFTMFDDEYEAIAQGDTEFTRALEENVDVISHTHFFRYVVWPMLILWLGRKSLDRELVVERVGRIKAEDWQLACRLWLQRREKNHG